MDGTDKQIERECPDHLKVLPRKTLREIFKTANALRSMAQVGGQEKVDRYLTALSNSQRRAINEMMQLSSGPVTIDKKVIRLFSAFGVQFNQAAA